jgi:hypothetical protein
MTVFAEDFLQRFWEKVDKDGPTHPYRSELGPCWVWAASGQDGYGRIGLNGVLKLAHRVSYEIANGPTALCVLHSCDNRPCCNPAHLRAGTQAENARDMFDRKRVERLRGEAHPRSKLTAAQVADLRRKRGAGAQLKGLAAEFGISLSQVSKIARLEARK